MKKHDPTHSQHSELEPESNVVTFRSREQQATSEEILKCLNSLAERIKSGVVNPSALMFVIQYDEDDIRVGAVGAFEDDVQPAIDALLDIKARMVD